jgi:hypothetical protein
MKDELEEYYKNKYNELIKEIRRLDSEMIDRYFDSLKNPKKEHKYNGLLNLIKDDTKVMG